MSRYVTNFYLNQDIRTIALLEAHVGSNDWIVRISDDGEAWLDVMCLTEHTHLLGLTLLDKRREFCTIERFHCLIVANQHEHVERLEDSDHLWYNREAWRM